MLPLVTAPEESSIKCAVSEGVVPFQSAAGRKRTDVPAARTSALPLDTLVEMFVQVAPFNHCHTPWPASVAALLVIAMPARLFALDPPATWSAASEKLPPNSEVTVAPDGDAASSSIAASVALPDATGASFTALTVIATVSVSLSAPPDPVLP